MKLFTKIAIAVFSLVAVLHLPRLIFGWEVVISGIVVPLWISIVGFIIAAGLAFSFIIPRLNRGIQFLYCIASGFPPARE